MISNIRDNYFNGFQQLFNFKNNDSYTNFKAFLKVASYFTLIIPFGLGTVCKLDSLYNRVTKKESPTPLDTKVDKTGKSTLDPKKSEITSYPTRSLAEIEKSYFGKTENYVGNFPTMNLNNLLNYEKSEDYKRHAKTAKIYYNATQLAPEDALTIIFRREPTNIGMQQHYKKDDLFNLFGYRESAFNDKNLTKKDGTLYRELPNTAAVYSETYMWSVPFNTNDKREIACLSLPAPALDTNKQPQYDYYMERRMPQAKDALKRDLYKKEMEFLFQTVEKAVRDHMQTAFEGKGLKRVVLSLFGQGAFLQGLWIQEDMQFAFNTYKEQLALFVGRMKDTNLEIVTSIYEGAGTDWATKVIEGDILHTAREGDLIINSWDPHSAPGNGNDYDKSFDGAMGRATGILLTQTAWMNEKLRNPDSLVPVNPS